MSCNRVILMGRLTKDPEQKYSKNGDLIVTFSIAINDYNKDVSYFNCVSFKKTAEIVQKFGKKGELLIIEGSLKQSRWKDAKGESQSRIEIIANSVNVVFPQKKEEENNHNFNDPWSES